MLSKFIVRITSCLKECYSILKAGMSCYQLGLFYYSYNQD